MVVEKVIETFIITNDDGSITEVIKTENGFYERCWNSMYGTYDLKKILSINELADATIKGTVFFGDQAFYCIEEPNCSRTLALL